MKQLINKGYKRVDSYMRNRGYQLYDCIETETGYEAEWYTTFAGVTRNTVYIIYNKNWRVTEVR